MQGRQIGHYEIGPKLGEGGVGEVYRAFDGRLNRAVAIKRLRPELRARDDIVARFKAEAQTLAPLNHPNVGILYGLETDADDLLMVMELVEGESLAALVARHGALDIADALDLFDQALDGLAHVHRSGVVHRDIKAANLILGRDGRVKIMDFGIAHVLGNDRFTQVGQLVGTPEFMSPEQVRGEPPDARSDLYAMGILLFDLLTGRLPFRATAQFDIMRAQTELEPEVPSEHRSEIPPELDAVVMRLLAKDPAKRFQNAESVREALAPIRAALEDPDHERPPLQRLMAPPASGGAKDMAPTSPWLTAVPLDGSGQDSPTASATFELPEVTLRRHRRRRHAFLAFATLIALLGPNWLRHDSRLDLEIRANDAAASDALANPPGPPALYDRDAKRARTAEAALDRTVSGALASNTSAPNAVGTPTVAESAAGHSQSSSAAGGSRQDAKGADPSSTGGAARSTSANASDAGKTAAQSKASKASPPRRSKAKTAAAGTSTKSTKKKSKRTQKATPPPAKARPATRKTADSAKESESARNQDGWMIRR